MAEHSIEVGEGDVIRIGDVVVRVRSIDGDEVTFEVIEDPPPALTGRDDSPGDSPRLPR